MKRTPQTLSEVIKLVEKLDMAQQVRATLSPPRVDMMLSDNRCFVCGKTGHIGHLSPNMQCYNCDGFGHLAQNFSEKILLSGMPHHHDMMTFRSHSQSHYSHDCRGK